MSLEVPQLKGSPPFSIVLTTYNRCALLPHAIHSALNQTFTDFELIIVDDASTDATPSIVGGFVDPRIHYLRQARNCGVSAARNIGVRHARGRYIAFLDDDDTLAPDYLDEVFRVLEPSAANVGFLLPWRHVIKQAETGERSTIRYITYGVQDAHPQKGERFFKDLAGASCGLVVKAVCFSSVGAFDERFRAAGDTELLIRLAAAYDYIVLPKPVYQVTKHPGEQLTKPSASRAQVYHELLTLHHATLIRYPHLIRGLLKHSGVMYYQAGCKAQGRQVFRQLFLAYPWHVEYLAYFALVEIADYLPACLSKRIYTLRR